jgi:hypothetical protein
MPVNGYSPAVGGVSESSRPQTRIHKGRKSTMSNNDKSAPTDGADEKSTSQSTTRRKLLTALGAGGVVATQATLPGTWSKPVVETLMLPAHAQTTPTDASSTTGDEPCNPDCVNRECGSDGCGGDCGACGTGQICVDGVCVQCVPDCNGLQCGDDGCGGSCGSCGGGMVCVNGQCVSIVP